MVLLVHRHSLLTRQSRQGKGEQRSTLSAITLYSTIACSAVLLPLGGSHSPMQTVMKAAEGQENSTTCYKA